MEMGKEISMSVCGSAKLCNAVACVCHHDSLCNYPDYPSCLWFMNMENCNHKTKFTCDQLNQMGRRYWLLFIPS